MNQPRRPRRRKRRLLKFLLFCAFCAAFFWWSNHSLQTERFTFASPRLPEGFDGCVIVQLSDLHGAEFGENNETLLACVRDAAPDYIFLTGDLQDRYRETPSQLFRESGAGAGADRSDLFVTGNHEWAFPDVRELKRELRDAGLRC